MRLLITPVDLGLFIDQNAGLRRRIILCSNEFPFRAELAYYVSLRNKKNIHGTAPRIFSTSPCW